MLTLPLNPSSLWLIAPAALLPGLCLRQKHSHQWRTRRVAAASLLGTAAGSLLGASTLGLEMSLPQCVPLLLISVSLFAEGLAGRGRPWAGFLASAAYLASLVWDFLDRNGGRAHPIVWIVIAAIAAIAGAAAQGTWRGIWNLRRERPSAAPPPPPDSP